LEETVTFVTATTFPVLVAQATPAPPLELLTGYHRTPPR